MQIGDIAKQSGFSKDTLRYYEKIGLITLDKKLRGANNYRIYDGKILHKLTTIKQLKQVGFTLKEIKDLMRKEELNMISCTTVGAIVQPKLVKIEQQILELQRQKEKLECLIQQCDGECAATLETYNKDLSIPSS